MSDDDDDDGVGVVVVVVEPCGMMNGFDGCCCA